MAEIQSASYRHAPALAQIERLITIMQRLRGPDGCAWDRSRSFADIAPYTIEEAYEVADAIAQADMENLAEELGDLLLQVVFHAAIATDAGHFDLVDVARGICDKLERRHPQVFGEQNISAPVPDWDSIKAAEKPSDSALDNIPLALPALLRAEKLSRRAARTGFDWPDATGPLAKIHEELAEVASAQSDAERQAEAGDLLFAVVNYLRKLNIDAEAALRDGNRKFERRFRAIERTAGFVELPLAAKEQLWQAEKRKPIVDGSDVPPNC